MFKFILGIQIAFWLGWVLGDAFTGFCFQLGFMAGYFIPGKVWLGIARAAAELAPYLLFATLMDN
jgi:hypothetical protein